MNVWAVALVLAVAIITYGVYMTVRAAADLADELHQVKRKNSDLYTKVGQQSDEILRLKDELQKEKNRKIYPSDEP